jgi:hypothetical protein
VAIPNFVELNIEADLAYITDSSHAIVPDAVAKFLIAL